MREHKFAFSQLKATGLFKGHKLWHYEEKLFIVNILIINFFKLTYLLFIDILDILTYAIDIVNNNVDRISFS